MKVSDLYYEIGDGLDMSGDIISIDVVKENDKPVGLSIKATCPNYPEVSCGYYQISLNDISDCIQSVCSENINDDLRNLASYEYHQSINPEKN